MSFDQYVYVSWDKKVYIYFRHASKISREVKNKHKNSYLSLFEA